MNPTGRALFHSHTQTLLDAVPTEPVEALHDDICFFHVGEADWTTVEVERFEREFHFGLVIGGKSPRPTFKV